ncbi:Nucleotide-binding universal stress protein, UspA family [Thermus arciformis]|uniref:Nucleotide-binding universal stress protein, UspA family n=1 Tax=Thermus arciformis TaxID=482827 RepID=A0A1G7LC40_9DEIN|nr:universal stress protein [Thermus arciformis]SDF47033.1 Nucleotide-binding universal stress protein, UspA family [Thermus arciformis]
MRLLAAVDLGSSLEALVESARFLQGGLGVPAQVLHVVPSPYWEDLARRFPHLAPQVEELLRLARAEVEKALGATGLPVQVLRGFPAQVVAAEALKSKLVLLGRGGEVPLEALAKGGLARYLLHRGEVPVLLLPRALAGVRRIAVGLDESPASLAAFRVAEAWGRALGAEVLGLHLVSGHGGCCFPTYLDPGKLSVPEVLERAKAHLEALLKATGAVEVSWGEAEEDLLRLAEARGADLLVLGSKARSTWRHRLGRMVEVLVLRSPLPLLVVPEAAVW